MLDFLIHTDKYFYMLWTIVWLCIAFININIYGYYNNEEVSKLGNIFANDLGGSILVSFTFRWKIDDDDPKKIIILKKLINYGVILFALLTIYCVGIWTYKFNNTQT